MQTQKDNIKNDLRRVSKWACEATSDLPIAQMNVFLTHAQKGLENLKIDNVSKLKEDLKEYQNQLPMIQDDLERIRWAEKVLTLSCRI